ncbi:MAG: hypothetical protein F6K55_33785 [Moorea sp. SIO4A3]|nr:hypothetical protein [Moorena sp. SIO4A3]
MQRGLGEPVPPKGRQRRPAGVSTGLESDAEVRPVANLIGGKRTKAQPAGVSPTRTLPQDRCVHVVSPKENRGVPHTDQKP